MRPTGEAGAKDNPFLDVGAFSTEVKKDALLAAARKAGIDLAVAFIATIDASDKNPASFYSVFLVDAASGKVYEETRVPGYDPSRDGSWIRAMIRTIESALQEYAEDNEIFLKPAR